MLLCAPQELRRCCPNLVTVKMNVKEILNKYFEEGSALLNLLTMHSEMVARKALSLVDAAKLDVDREFVWNAAMLHDIGIFRCDAPSIHCHGTEPYIRHGIIGAAIMRELGYRNVVTSSGQPLGGNVYQAIANVCERHTGSGLTAKEIAERGLPLPHQDFLPVSLEEKLICYADKFYSKSGDPTSEKPFDRVRASMAKFGPDSLARFDTLTDLFKRR